MLPVLAPVLVPVLAVLAGSPAHAQAEVAHGLPASLPASLSVGGMFMQADWVVKLVIVGLLAASVATWTIFMGKTMELKKLAAAQKKANEVLNTARSLDAVRGHADVAGPMLEAAWTEMRLSSDALHDSDGIKERIATRFNRLEAEAGRGMTRGINLLATIGATAPFVGLFGTVWGIMNSFIGIAQKQTTNLAVVAPGIAEALLATAVGLVAAIPAVIIYNHFSRQVAAQRALLADTSAAILNLVSRDLSRGIKLLRAAE
jgi:biopolymer transport protein ExbB